MKKITVLGSGIIGLTTAITLEKAGFEVRIITRQLHFKTTSAIAAAIWMPFKSAPVELVNKWSLETYAVFKQQSTDPLTGISMVDFKYLCQDDATPPFTAAMPPGTLREAYPGELPTNYSYGWIAHVPMIESPLYLEYLFDEFRGEIILDEVLDFKEVEAPDVLVINCTGLGSKALIQDDELYPVKGQIVKIAPAEHIVYAADDHPDHFLYIIPRRDGIVLGGTAEAHNYDLSTSETITKTILERCKKVEPKINKNTILAVEAGLRPYRSTVRLEKEIDRNIIHNYGHGGSGYTISWGCAKAVLQLVGKE